MTSNNVSAAAGHYRPAGQRLEIAPWIRNAIRQYPLGPALFKEFLQNADDAGASAVRFILDGRTHAVGPRRGALSHRLFAGPSLLICNDSTFTEPDFEAIQLPNQSSKRDAAGKTGRFGIGFNVAYTASDYPSVVSRGRLLIFDPHSRHEVSAETRHPGFEFKLDERSWKHDRDLLDMFAVGGLLAGTTDHAATIFRLPLRSADDARCSTISNTSCALADLHQIALQIAPIASDLLLFLKHVTGFHIEAIGADGSTSKLLSASILNADLVRRERARLTSYVGVRCADCLLKLRADPASAPRVAFVQSVRVALESESRVEHWAIASGLYVDPDLQVVQAAQRMLDQDEGKAIPWAGAAVRLLPREGGNFSVAPVSGRLFTFLPLPRETRLPLHLNGFFDLNNSREWVTEDGDAVGQGAARVQWNRLMFKHCVSAAHVQLLEHLAAAVKGVFDDAANFYKVWPAVEDGHGLLGEASVPIYKALYDRYVIRSADGGHARPRDLEVPPADWPELQEPLVAKRYLCPSPPLPVTVLNGFERSGSRLKPLQPSTLRLQLSFDRDVDSELASAPQVWLRKRCWVIQLLKFCASDGSNADALRGLPLALLQNGRLHTFGFTPQPLFLPDAGALALLPGREHLFLDQELATEARILPSNAGCVRRFDAFELLQQIGQWLAGRDGEPIVWDPSSATTPNKAWLTGVYRYLSKSSPQLLEQAQRLQDLLTRVPIVPDQFGRLGYAGRADTPLLPEATGDDGELFAAMDAAGVARLRADGELLDEIRRYHAALKDSSCIWSLTGQDLLDAIADACDATPELFDTVAPRHWDTLLHFLSSARWFPKYAEQERIAKLRKLRVWPTANGERIALDHRDPVYLSSTFAPPSIGGAVRVIPVEGRPWKGLLRLANVPELDSATFVTSVLLDPKRFNGLPPADQIRAVSWLRDNLTALVRTMERQDAEASKRLAAAVRNAAIVRCRDGVLRSAPQVYDPRDEAVRSLLGELVPLLHVEFYGEERDKLAAFFVDQGLRQIPTAQDLLKVAEDIAGQAARPPTALTRSRIHRLLSHLAAHFEQYRDATIDAGRGPTHFFRELSQRAWMCSWEPQKASAHFYAAMAADSRLYRPIDLHIESSGPKIASQAPIALLPHEGQWREVAYALGIRSKPPLEVVLDHLDSVLGHRKQIPDSDEKQSRLFEEAVGDIYTFLGMSLSPTAMRTADGGPENGELDPNVVAIRKRFDSRPCLWDKKTRRLLIPKATFKTRHPALKRFYDRLAIKEPALADRGLEVLGRRPAPGIGDFVAAVRLQAERLTEGRITDSEVLKELIQIYELIDSVLTTGSRGTTSLEIRTTSGPGDYLPVEVRDLLLLTREGRLVPVALIVEADTGAYDDKFRGAQLHVAHEKLSPSLLRNLRVPRLSELVTVELNSLPPPVKDAKHVEQCRGLTARLRSPTFRDCVRRLVLNQGGGDPADDLHWLPKLQVVPAERIDTSLSVMLPEIGVAVDEDHPPVFFERNEFRPTIYLLMNLAWKSNLVSALKEALGAHAVRAGELLVALLELETDRMHQALDQASVRRLPNSLGEESEPPAAHEDEDEGVTFASPYSTLDEGPEYPTEGAGDVLTADPFSEEGAPDKFANAPAPGVEAGRGPGSGPAGRTHPDGDGQLRPSPELPGGAQAHKGSHVVAGEAMGPRNSRDLSERPLRPVTATDTTIPGRDAGAAASPAIDPRPAADGGRVPQSRPNTGPEQGTHGLSPRSGRFAEPRGAPASFPEAGPLHDRPPQPARPKAPLSDTDAAEASLQRPTPPTDRRPQPAGDLGPNEIGEPSAQRPRVLGRGGRAVTYVVDGTRETKHYDSQDDQDERNRAIAAGAVAATIEFEQSQGRTARSMNHSNPGFDVMSARADGSDERFIEVKGVGGSWNDAGVPVSRRQMECNLERGDAFWLYVVEFANDPTRRRLFAIRNPAQQIDQFRFDRGWSAFAEPAPTAARKPQLPPPQRHHPDPHSPGRVSPRPPAKGQKVRLSSGLVGEVLSVRPQHGSHVLELKLENGHRTFLKWRADMTVVR